jgi:hypothetical protein
MSIAEIRARWAGVGPWMFSRSSCYIFAGGKGGFSEVAKVWAIEDGQQIAAAPTDIATLLAALDERDKRIAELEAAQSQRDNLWPQRESE